MRRLTDREIREHFLPAAPKPAAQTFPKAILKEVPKDKVQEARIFLWRALQLIGQAKHENRDNPVVDIHLKEADEQVRGALRLIL